MRIVGMFERPVNISVYGSSLAPRVGLEPTTTRLTAECSTIELSRIISKENIHHAFKTEYQISLYPFG